MHVIYTLKTFYKHLYKGFLGIFLHSSYLPVNWLELCALFQFLRRLFTFSSLFVNADIALKRSRSLQSEVETGYVYLYMRWGNKAFRMAFKSF